MCDFVLVSYIQFVVIMLIVVVLFSILRICLHDFIPPKIL